MHTRKPIAKFVQGSFVVRKVKVKIKVHLWYQTTLKRNSLDKKMIRQRKKKRERGGNQH